MFPPPPLQALYKIINYTTISVSAKDYNRGFGIIRHKSPKVAANDLYTYESKHFLRTIDKSRYCNVFF